MPPAHTILQNAASKSSQARRKQESGLKNAAPGQVDGDWNQGKSKRAARTHTRQQRMFSPLILPHVATPHRPNPCCAKLWSGFVWVTA